MAVKRITGLNKIPHNNNKTPMCNCGPEEVCEICVDPEMVITFTCSACGSPFNAYGMDIVSRPGSLCYACTAAQMKEEKLHPKKRVRSIEELSDEIDKIKEILSELLETKI